MTERKWRRYFFNCEVVGLQREETIFNNIFGAFSWRPRRKRIKSLTVAMLVQSWVKPETTKPVVACSPSPALFWHLIGSTYFHRPENKLVCFWIYLSDEKVKPIRKLFNWISREAEGWGTNVWLHEKDKWYLSLWGCKDSKENVRLQENVLNSERDCQW